MEILLWIVVWLLVGCIVAWLIGAAASMGDVPVNQESPHPESVANIDHLPLAERTPANVDVELRVAGTEQGRFRSL
jgi:hypothetical protein